jgi:hypothetical protein
MSNNVPPAKQLSDLDLSLPWKLMALVEQSQLLEEALESLPYLIQQFVGADVLQLMKKGIRLARSNQMDWMYPGREKPYMPSILLWANQYHGLILELAWFLWTFKNQSEFAEESEVEVSDYACAVLELLETIAKLLQEILSMRMAD